MWNSYNILPYLDISELFPWEQFIYFGFFLYLEIFGWEQLKNHPVHTTGIHILQETRRKVLVSKNLGNLQVDQTEVFEQLEM